MGIRPADVISLCNVYMQFASEILKDRKERELELYVEKGTKESRQIN